ncbi:MAG: hypothetical protein IIA62_03505, partial [Nitrospinae bacterium]|nr:hypothetical protein [Nitrospinota bacterium]
MTEDLQYILNAETVTIYAVDPFKKQLYACNYLSASGEEIRLDIAETSLAGLAAITKEVINVTNAFDRNELNSLHPNLTPDKAWIKKVKQKSLPVILAPMTQNKKLTGILEVLNKTNGGTFVDEDIRLIEEVASTLSHTLAKRELGVSEELVRATSHVIHSATTVDDIFLKLKDPIKRLFSAQAVIIYAVNEAKMSLYTKERSGDNIKDISMPIKANNIPGYVALEKKLTNFKNVRDKKVLKGIHPDISYDKSDDKRLGLKAQSMLVYPLLSNKKLMGVLQIIKDEDTFYSQDVKNINTIGESLALALFNKKKQIQLKPTKYSYLISNGILTQEELTRATSKARSAGKEVEYYLIKKLKIKTADIGKSLSKYYSMPYQGYSDSILLPKNLFAGLNLNFLIKNSWFPIEKDEKKVVILIDDPLDLDKIRNIELTFPKKDIEYKVSLKSEIHKFLETTPEEEEVEEESRPMEAMSSLLESLETEKSIEEAILESAQQEQELSAISETDNTIGRLANKILIDAYEQGVSD